MNIETTQGTLNLILLQHEEGGDVIILVNNSVGRSGEQMEILPQRIHE